MMQATNPKGEAEVEGKFSLSGRGTHLVLKDGWKGRFEVGDVLLWNDRRSRIASFGMGRKVPPPDFVAIRIEDEAMAQEISAGDIVHFLASEGNAAT